MEAAMVGAIEGGGTKFVCAVGTGPGAGMTARIEFPTGNDPVPLMGRVVGWFREQQQVRGRLGAMGFASFGPVDLRRGVVTSTPKPGWRNADVLSPLRQAFPGIPIAFDTDTNGAALGEQTWGNAQGLDDFVYLTIGTGIGAGIVANGKLVHGLVHPEVGHIFLPSVPGDTFEGACPYHGRCWEGLCSGPAILKRTGIPADELPADHPAWEFVARYVGFALANLVFTLSPRRIILGGSVRKGGRLGEDEFFRRIRSHLHEVLNGYVVSQSLEAVGLRDFLVPPGLGDDTGVVGALAMAMALDTLSP
jgi:fructokinase